jgi:hypothetical protein
MLPLKGARVVADVRQLGVFLEPGGVSGMTPNSQQRPLNFELSNIEGRGGIATLHDESI